MDNTWPCGPDWFDYLLWFLFWCLLGVIFSVESQILVQGLVLFVTSFVDLGVSIYYCLRWKRHKCCGEYCSECCPAKLVPNNPYKEKYKNDQDRHPYGDHLDVNTVELGMVGGSDLTEKRSPTSPAYMARRSTLDPNARHDCECRCYRLSKNSTCLENIDDRY